MGLEFGIAGLGVLIVEGLKYALLQDLDEGLRKQVLVPVLVFVVVTLLWTGYASFVALEPVGWREAVNAALDLGFKASGIYGIGKALIGKS